MKGIGAGPGVGREPSRASDLGGANLAEGLGGVKTKGDLGLPLRKGLLKKHDSGCRGRCSARSSLRQETTASVDWRMQGTRDSSPLSTHLG